MRKLNMFLVIGMAASFLAHAIMGSLQLIGADSGAFKGAAWVCVAFISAHVAVSTALTIQTLNVRKKSGAGYFKNNLMFWARRITGITIVIPLVMHLVIFQASNADAYRLKAFTRGRLISQILLIVTLALHILINVKPALMSFGVKGHKVLAIDIIFVLSLLLLIFSAAFAIYYLRWTTF